MERVVEEMSETKNEPQRNSIFKAVRSIVIILIGMAAIYIGFTFALGTGSPFFVVSSGSMVPTLEVGDIIIVNGNAGFDDLVDEEIIVFHEPGFGSKVIVHRIENILDDSTREIITKGDHNAVVDKWRVTDEDYIGKVILSIPKVGYLTTFLAPPLNYIVIVLVIAIIFVLEINTKKPQDEQNEEESNVEQPFEPSSDEPQPEHEDDSHPYTKF